MSKTNKHTLLGLLAYLVLSSIIGCMVLLAHLGQTNTGGFWDGKGFKWLCLVGLYVCGTIFLVIYDLAVKGNIIYDIGYSGPKVLNPSKRPEKWAISLAWWIPRKYRGDIVGDILEDCNEMRDKSCREWRICVQVIWQWAIAVANLIPAAIVGSIWCRLNLPK